MNAVITKRLNCSYKTVISENKTYIDW